MKSHDGHFGVCDQLLNTQTFFPLAWSLLGVLLSAPELIRA